MKINYITDHLLLPLHLIQPLSSMYNLGPLVHSLLEQSRLNFTMNFFCFFIIPQLTFFSSSSAMLFKHSFDCMLGKHTKPLYAQSAFANGSRVSVTHFSPFLSWSFAFLKHYPIKYVWTLYFPLSSYLNCFFLIFSLAFTSIWTTVEAP